MATKNGIEMSSYSPADSSFQQVKAEEVTFWTLFERAAKAQYGANIRVIKIPQTTNLLDNLNFQLSVVSVDIEPKETGRTIMDINMKEYTNNGQKEVDETVVKVHKSTSRSQGNRFSFSTTKGVNWGIGGNIGAQVMGLAMAGGSASVSANYGRHTSTTTGNEQLVDNNLSFSYSQEEKISVSPGTRVKARITTYSVRYEQKYTLKFSIDSTLNVPLTYKTRCQQTCFGKNIGYVNITAMLNCLPNYRIENGKATFTQDGTLSWVGEGCRVEKSEESLI